MYRPAPIKKKAPAVFELSGLADGGGALAAADAS
jgi:hypothetical protein